jgi:hypothetical protein
MNFLLRHPALSGLGFEALLVALFMCFPVGPCNAPPIGVAVFILHYPAIISVECVLGIGWSPTQFLLTAILMTPVWICLLMLAQSLLQRRRRESSHK